MGLSSEEQRPTLGGSVDSTKWSTQRVLQVHQWAPTMLSWRCTRDERFRFTPGHYARLGVESDAGEIVWRPFSMVSAAADDGLEFLAVLVPGGAFSKVLASLSVGDALHCERASFGFLTVDQLAAGRQLWMLASGSGLGPFVSILRDPAVWSRFERLFVVHSVRHASELAYRAEICALADENAAVAGKARLVYLPVVTREPGATALSARIPQLLTDGRLEEALETPLTVEASRLMICGNPEMALELRRMLGARGFAAGRRGIAGQMAFEKYW